jgi:hypothetical protein
MFCAASIFVAGQGQVEPAVRVVRFQVDYPEAQLDTVRKVRKRGAFIVGIR